ncbi:MAG: GntG family PLP-dependent aldolase [Verrucomicrobiales bacterium]|nr:GntG family PLP-dependent aldolase [Verrucomicrobiales bacterium]
MIDLRSDTVTKPTPAMKQAMFAAEVGDDVMGEDPTVNALEAKVAALTGKEAALFTCSATQANQIAINVHCSPGDEILINSTSHIGLYEAGGPAAISGVSLQKIDAPRGFLSVECLEGRIWPDDPHFTRSRLVCLENTSNMGGGFAWPIEQIRSVSNWCLTKGLKIHLDGARLFHAVVEKGYSPGDICAAFDTVNLCFSKGLGCPMGAVLAGTEKDIHKARRVRKMLGGGCRQIGFAAGAALYALDHHVQRLAEDHAKATHLAKELSRIKGINLVFGLPETNLVFFEISGEYGDARSLETHLRKNGVQIGSSGRNRLRAVTHLDIASEDIPVAADAIRQGLEELKKNRK